MAAKRSGTKAADASPAPGPDAQTHAENDGGVQRASAGAADNDAGKTEGTAGHGEGGPQDVPETGGEETGARDAPDTRLHDLEREAADLRERLARARADYQNLQRRVERDALLEKQRVKARFLEDFLQVYEYGQMAASEAERNPGPLADGVRMVVREFDRLLDKEGVESVGKFGEPFDREIHEAVATEAADGVAAGHVSRVVAPGYRLGERVLRYAKVAVAPGDEEE